VVAGSTDEEGIHMPSGEELSQTHPLVDALVPDADAEPVQTVVLTGFHDLRPRDDYVRLYVTLDLSEWVEIPRAAVRQFQSGEPDDLMAPTTVWVVADAEIEYGFREPPENFLAGDLLQQVLKTTQGVTAGALGGSGASVTCVTTPRLPSPLTPLTSFTTLACGYTTPRTTKG
jgi:hypothetical protein